MAKKKTDDSEIIEAEVVTSSSAEPLTAEEKRSLASRVLTALGFLVAGAVLALWAGPQVAPLLPAGLKPVADFLAPQADSATEIRLTELEDALRGFENRANARFEDLQQADLEFTTDIASLGREVRSNGSSGVSSAAIARLDAAIDDLQDRVTELNNKMANLEPSSGSSTGSEDFGAAQSAIAALQNDLRQLTQAQTALKTEFDTKTSDFEARLATAQSNMSTVTEAASLQVGTAQNRQLVVELERALNSGEPFFALVNDSELTLPPGLATVSNIGVATLPELQTAFPDLAYEAIRADIDATAGDGSLNRVSAFLQKQVAVRSLEPIEGTSADAILSRMEAALNVGDLDTVLSEANGLSLQTKDVLSLWLEQVQQRVTAFAALQDFALSAQSQ